MKVFLFLALAATSLHASGGLVSESIDLKIEQKALASGFPMSFTKIVDKEENRVCYAVTGSSTGGNQLVCFDRKSGQ
ncbi:hypothetical protein K2X33_13945 [bacterium]|nr:hypothetical protein [bacterium]